MAPRCTIVVALVLLCAMLAAAGPLEDYLNMPDDSFQWKLTKTVKGTFATGYVFNVTSQTWWEDATKTVMVPSSIPIWYHYMVIIVPFNLNASIAGSSFLYVDGSDQNDIPGDNMWALDSMMETAAINTGAIVVHVYQIPVEPVYFAGDNHTRRTEDAIIAYTWKHFLTNTSYPFWLLRLPMVKAVQRCMDVVQAFIPTLDIPGVPSVNQFMIAGASKRGWVTWLVGAMDPRVFGIVPIVMPILNMVPNINHQYQCYGNWSFAFSDYLNEGVMQYLNEPVFLEMAAIIDPISYLPQLDMPKIVIMAAGDEFFEPDLTQYFYHDLIGETHLRIIPNAEHSMITHVDSLIFSMSSFFLHVVNGWPRPNPTWVLDFTAGTITVNVSGDVRKPTAVTRWWAHTSQAVRRDFRLVICDQLPACVQMVPWSVETMGDNGTGIYVATLDTPPSGWSGMLVQLEYEEGSILDPFGKAQYEIYTSEVLILPNTLPFAPCGDHCQPSTA